MCDCIEKYREFLKEVAIKNIGCKEEDILGVEIDNVSYFLEKGRGMELTSPGLVEYKHTTRKGKVITKKFKIGLSYKFCPWCGEEYGH